MFIQEEHDINPNIYKKNNSEKLWLNLYVTKAKYSKSLQRQRTKGEIKSSFISAVIICINVSTNEI